MKRAALLTVAIVACGGAAAAPARTTPRAAAAPAPSADVAIDAGADGASSDGGEPADDVELVQGCTPAGAEALRLQIEAILPRLFSEGASAADALRDIRALWEKPCLAHLARFVPPPRSGTLRSIRDAWSMGFGAALSESVGGLHRRYGHRLLIIPPQIVPDLPSDALGELAGLACPESDATCTRSGSFIARAHAVFDAAEELDTRNNAAPWQAGQSYFIHDPVACQSEQLAPRSPFSTAFESWAPCALGALPYNVRFADMRLRAPERGWLVLRGRRGHYQFADEVRAYDLATGAAYVARTEGGLILGGNDFAPDASRKPEGFTGRVAPDQARELAFLLLARRAAIELRTRAGYLVVPDSIPLAVGTGERTAPDGVSRGLWSSSGQTHLDFALVVDGAVQKRGRFTWPDSSDRVEDHIDHLVLVLEAGLVRACAPARLPATIGGASGIGAVSSLDADAAQLAAVQKDLDRALDALRAKSCPGAK